MAPCPLTKADGTMKSAKPPRTRKGAFGFFRGYDAAKLFSETVAQIRVSLPTLPHLRFGRENRQSRRSTSKAQGIQCVRELHTAEVRTLFGELGYQVRIEVDAAARAGDCSSRSEGSSEGKLEGQHTVVDDHG